MKSISFLAADLTSEAFNHPRGWTEDQQEIVALSEDQIPILRRQIDELTAEWENTGFVLENREKLLRLRRAILWLTLDWRKPSPPFCNAPWVSAVVETDGTVRPCFFHRPFGRLNGGSLLEILNGPQAVAFRTSLNVKNNTVCRRCVCSLNWRR